MHLDTHTHTMDSTGIYGDNWKCMVGILNALIIYVLAVKPTFLAGFSATVRK